jgi:dTMP kinase
MSPASPASPSPPAGRFLVFEGLDGAGTTTQTNRLIDRLRAAGRRAEPTREPTSGPLGGVIRLAIEQRFAIAPHALALAFAADRVDHYHNDANGIALMMRRGVNVVCDRYVLSSLAYQALDMAPEWIAEINREAPPPARTYFLRVDPAVAWRRIADRSVADELYHVPERLNRIAANYERALEIFGARHRVVVLDGEQPPDAIAAQVWEDVRGLLAGAPDGQNG